MLQMTFQSALCICTLLLLPHPLPAHGEDLAATVRPLKLETIGRTKGWGEQKPVAPNQLPDGTDDPEGRQKNRHVEITVKK